jgi:hypothetical protein
VFVRSCGGCNACCSELEITALEKPAGVLCSSWRTGSGCSVYATRPDACRSFRCLWLDGMFDKRTRPDKSGLLCGFKATTTPFASVTFPSGGGELRAAARELSRNLGLLLAVAITAKKTPADEVLHPIVAEVPVFLKIGEEPVRAIVTREWMHLFPDGKMNASTATSRASLPVLRQSRP